MSNYITHITKLLTGIAGFILISAIYASSSDPKIDWSKPLGLCWEIQNIKGYKIASDNVTNNSSLNIKHKLIIIYNDRTIISLNPTTGQLIWSNNIEEIIQEKPLILGNYFLTLTKTDDNFYISSYELTSGLLSLRKKTKKTHDFTYNGRSIYDYENDYIEIQSDKQIINKYSNEITQDITISEYLGKTFILTIDINNNIRIYDKKNGKLLWERKIGGKVSDIKINDGKLFISSFDSYIYLFNLSNGNLDFKKRLDGRIIEKSSIQENIIATASYTSNSIYFFDTKKETNINIVTLSDASEFFVSFAFYDNILVAATSLKIYAFSPLCK